MRQQTSVTAWKFLYLGNVCIHFPELPDQLSADPHRTYRGMHLVGSRCRNVDYMLVSPQRLKVIRLHSVRRQPMSPALRLHQRNA